MADISANMTVAAWLRARAEVYLDFSDSFLYSVMLGRGITDDETLVIDASERQRDLMLADVLWSAATSSQKSGTQGETDGGWTHYVALKNVVDRDGLKAMAKDLYDKWGIKPPNQAKISMKSLY